MEGTIPRAVEGTIPRGGDHTACSGGEHTAWRGPYRAEERVGPCDYRIMIGGKEKLFHANLLKRYVSREEGQVSVLVVGEQEEWEPVITTTENVPTTALTKEEEP